MPTKKKYFLIDASEFEKAVKINNPQELEKYLMKLMELANEYYDEIYRKYEKNPDIEKFNFCKQNFNRIKSIIQLKESLINTPLYLEAWISMLYSEVHALNLEPKTIEELNELIETIQTVGTSFKQLLTTIPCLDLSNENSARLLKYIDAFEHTWKTKKERLLADIHFNFAETLVEQSNFQQGLYHFEKAENLYMEAANAADNTNGNKMLLEFSKQTKKRLEEIKTQPLEDYSNKLCKKLSIQLQRLPDSPSKWTIVNTSPPAQSIEENQAIEVKSFTEKKCLSSKIKRKSNEESTYLETKKQKIDPSIAYPNKIKSRWEKKCAQLLNKLDEIKIENYKLQSSSSNQHELIRFKASLASQYAIDIIKKLILTNEKLNNAKKLDYLKQAERASANSINFYNLAGLIREKGKAIQYQNILTSIINEFEVPIKAKKCQIKNKVISKTIQTSLSKSKIVCKDLRAYQRTLSDRQISIMFKTSFIEESCQSAGKPKSLPTLLSLTRSRE